MLGRLTEEDTQKTVGDSFPTAAPLFHVCVALTLTLTPIPLKESPLRALWNTPTKNELQSFFQCILFLQGLNLHCLSSLYVFRKLMYIFIKMHPSVCQVGFVIRCLCSFVILPSYIRPPPPQQTRHNKTLCVSNNFSLSFCS